MTSLRPMIVVQDNTVAVIRRFGQFNRVLTPGLNFVVPFLDQWVSVNWEFATAGGDSVYGYFIPTNSLLFDPDKLKCTTKDQITVEVDLILEFRIKDVRKAVSEVSNPFVAIETLIKTNLYKAIRALRLEECDPATIQLRTLNLLGDSCDKYGIGVTNLMVENVSIPKRIQDATVNVEANRRHALAELEKAKQEKELALAQSALEFEKLQAQHLKENLQIEHEGKKRKYESEMELEVKKNRLQLELDRENAMRDMEHQHLQKRLKIIKESGVNTQYLVEIERSKALQSLSESASSKIVVAPLDVLNHANGLLSQTPRQ